MYERLVAALRTSCNPARRPRARIAAKRVTRRVVASATAADRGVSDSGKAAGSAFHFLAGLDGGSDRAARSSKMPFGSRALALLVRWPVMLRVGRLDAAQQITSYIVRGHFPDRGNGF